MTNAVAVTTAPVVFQKDGKVFASSLDVADYFEKRHDHVLRDIRNLLASDPSFALPNFGERSATYGNNNSRPYYDMTRDGFVLLAMGFTGAKAQRFKIAYIEAFNRMETDLREAAVNLDNPAVLRSILAKYAERVEEMQPKAAFYDTYVEAGGSKTTREVAKLLGIPERKFFAALEEDGVFFKQSGTWMATSTQRGTGRFSVKTLAGPGFTTTQVRWTPKGVAWAAQRYGSAN